MSELIGVLGVPGALAALLGAALLGIRIYREIKAANGKASTPKGLSVEEIKELQAVKDRIDAAVVVLIADHGKLHKELSKAIVEGQAEVQIRVEKVHEVVDRIERFLLQRHKTGG